MNMASTFGASVSMRNSPSSQLAAPLYVSMVTWLPGLCWCIAAESWPMKLVRPVWMLG